LTLFNKASASGLSPGPRDRNAGRGTMSASTENTVRVEIYDQTYQIGGDSDGEYVRRLAARVDGLMRQITCETRVVDTVRVAVLASLNLADENEALRERCERLERLMREKSTIYHQMLERCMRAG
jgi:cell division protein ZapA (FtsZ GTPase activity inhibitor)